MQGKWGDISFLLKYHSLTCHDHLPHLANYDNDNAKEMITKTQELDAEAMHAQIEEVTDDLK